MFNWCHKTCFAPNRQSALSCSIWHLARAMLLPMLFHSPCTRCECPMQLAHSLSKAVDACGCLHLSGCTISDSFLYCFFTSSKVASNLSPSFSNGLILKAHRILQ